LTPAVLVAPLFYRFSKLFVGPGRLRACLCLWY